MEKKGEGTNKHITAGDSIENGTINSRNNHCYLYLQSIFLFLSFDDSSHQPLQEAIRLFVDN